MLDERLGISIERKAEGTFLVTLRGRIDSDTYVQLDEEIYLWYEMATAHGSHELLTTTIRL